LLPQRSSSFSREVWTAIRERGWAFSADLEDLGIALDRRLDGFEFRVLADALNLPFRCLFNKPRFVSSRPYGFDALSVVDVVAIFIFLEKCGFSIDSGQMVSDVLSQVSSSNYMTESEIDVFQYASTQHRTRLVLRSPESSVTAAPRENIVCRTSRGYRVEANVIGGAPTLITIRGPKWRKERICVDFNCPVCGMRYQKGNREEALSHRSYHARMLRLLQPAPHRKMQNRQVNIQNPEMVSHDSPIWMHREMYERAREFKREMQFDFIQWASPGPRRQREVIAVGFLMTSETGTIEGACAFRNGAAEWSLDWIWVRPNARRTGLLRERWAG
jgi:hypothetical protein